MFYFDLHPVSRARVLRLQCDGYTSSSQSKVECAPRVLYNQNSRFVSSAASALSEEAEAPVVPLSSNTSAPVAAGASDSAGVSDPHCFTISWTYLWSIPYLFEGLLRAPPYSIVLGKHCNDFAFPIVVLIFVFL